MGGKFGDGAFEGADDGVGGGAEGDAGGSLFDRFHCVFDLEETAFGRPDCHICVILIAEHVDWLFCGGRKMAMSSVWLWW